MHGHEELRCAGSILKLLRNGVGIGILPTFHSSPKFEKLGNPRGRTYFVLESAD